MSSEGSGAAAAASSSAAGSGESERRRNVDLVFEGGGVKGIALVGALEALEQHGFVAQNMAGASAGAIVAVLYAAGYTPGELYEILKRLEFRDFLDKGWEDRVLGVSYPLSILKDQGIYEGDVFREWLADLLAARGKHTFGDLVHPDHSDDPRFRHRAQVVVSDLTARRMLVLPRDSERFLGVDPDELSIAEAVRMSMSIPIFFEPVAFTVEKDGDDRILGEHVLVDGGMLSNFPVHVFDVDGEPDWPTFGLLLTEPEARASEGREITGVKPAQGPVAKTLDYAKSVLETLLEAHDRMYLEAADFARTIPIDSLGVKTTEFDLGDADKDALYESGRRAAEAFLQGWSFDAYIEHFRVGTVPSRRENLSRLMAN